VFRLPPDLLLPTVVAFVDLPTHEICCCWAEQLPPPDRVYVPQGGDSPQRRRWLQWDRAFIEHLSVAWGGSSNPCIEIPDSAPYLVPIGQFLEYALGLVRIDANQPIGSDQDAHEVPDRWPNGDPCAGAVDGYERWLIQRLGWEPAAKWLGKL
jgi:hypothetical protein